MGKERFNVISGIAFLSGGRVSIFLTSCVNNTSVKWGWGGVKFNDGRQFPASFQKHFETNQISSVALV